MKVPTVEEISKMEEMHIRVEQPKYPHADPDHVYEAFLSIINLDEEMKNDVITDNGFIINAEVNIRKDIKNIDGMFSLRYGPTLDDVGACSFRYRCECGNLKYRFNLKRVCPICGKPVKYMDDNLKYFGWLVLKDEYTYIHPNLFRCIESFIGAKKLNNILKDNDEKDENGFKIKTAERRAKGEIYAGIGMIDFKNKFDEIMQFYLKKYPNKKDLYQHIMNNKCCIFTHSLPVYTTHLRPYRVDGAQLYFEGTNSIYSILCRLAAQINQTNTRMDRKRKPKNQLLYDFQIRVGKLYTEIINILKGKKGIILQLFGGRYNFSSREVIKPNPALKIDEVRVPYVAYIELNRQRIINVLHKTYGMTFDKADKLVSSAIINKSDKDLVYKICLELINDEERGTPVLINRNPTIGFGSQLQMFIVGINMSYTLHLPLQVLELMAADFDGDVLNVNEIINQDAFNAFYRTLNPANNMMVSKNDGKFNNSVNHYRDTILNADNLIRVGRSAYTPDDIQRIEMLKAMI